MGFKQLWIKYGLGDKSRYIPIHTLEDRLGANTCDMLLKVHARTGCDVTSKLGTKPAALEGNFHQSVNFGTSAVPDSSSFLQAEKYLCSVLYPHENCSTFDTLRYSLYKKKNKPISALPPTSNMLYGHLQRSHYFVWLY